MQQHPVGVSGVGMLDGHLEMKVKRWKCFYVQLIGRQLLLFHDLNQTPTQIHIPEGATCKIGKCKRNNFQFSLAAGKTYFFRVPSELHRAKWMMHIIEASRGEFSPRRQASQRSVYSISSLSSVGSWPRCMDDGAPSEYLQFCRRSRNSRSTDTSPTDGDLGRRSRVTRRSLADCHLPLNNMRWYESAPSTPMPILPPGPSDLAEVDADIISLPDVSAALLEQRKPRQHLQRTGGMEDLGAMDELSKTSKFQDLSALHFSDDSSGSPLGDNVDTMETIDNYANFLQWSTYSPASIDALNSSLVPLMEPPRFHRSASLPHSLTEMAGEVYAPLEWVHTRTHPALSALSEHCATPQNHQNSPSPPDYENMVPTPPHVPERMRPAPALENLIEVSNHMNITEPELFPHGPSFNLRRSVLSSITRQHAEEILAEMAPGTFLVRYREATRHKLALSIRMGGKVLHHCILSEPHGCYAIEGFECHADSLDSLLEAFIRAWNGEVSLYCPEEPLSDDEAVEWQSNNSINAIL